MKKIVIIGGFGFCGLHLLKRLRSHKVVVIDPRTPTQEEKAFLSGQKFEHVADTFRPRHFNRNEIGHGVDVVVSLAGMLGSVPSVEEPLQCVMESVVSHVTVLDALKKRGMKPLFVFASSDLVYIQQKDDPRCAYTACKIFMEHMLNIFDRIHDIPFTALRLATGYGPMQRRDSVVNFYVRRALEGKTIPVWGDGQNRQAFIYADDIGRAFANACEGDFEGTWPLVGHNSRIIDIAETVSKLIGGEIVHGEFPEKARLVNVGDLPVHGNPPGFLPVVDLHEGVKLTARWMKKNAIQI